MFDKHQQQHVAQAAFFLPGAQMIPDIEAVITLKACINNEK